MFSWIQPGSPRLTLNPHLLISIFPPMEGSTRYVLSWIDRLNLKARGYPKSILGYCAENYPLSPSHPGALTSLPVGMQRKQPDPTRCQHWSLQWYQFSCHVSAVAWKEQQDPSRGCPSAGASFGWPSSTGLSWYSQAHLWDAASSIPRVCCFLSATWKEGRTVNFAFAYVQPQQIPLLESPPSLPSGTTSTPRSQAISQSCFINIKSHEKSMESFSLGDVWFVGNASDLFSSSFPKWHHS